jgi:Fe2+ or Zn2+ uptake regulation protein
MDYLGLNSVKKIIEMVAANDGQLTWYNIVKYIDQLDVKRVPPTYHVLKELVKLGYLRADPPGNDAKYWLTDVSRRLLVQQEVAT